MKKISILIGACCLCFYGMAQESVVSSGDYHSNTSGSISWTVGEVSTETYQGSSAILTQGQQQHYYDFTSVEEQSSDFNFSAYPNPVSDVMNIQVDNYQEGSLEIALYSLEGKLLLKERMDNSIHQIYLNQFEASNYIVTISNNSGQVIHKFQLTKI